MITGKEKITWKEIQSALFSQKKKFFIFSASAVKKLIFKKN